MLWLKRAKEKASHTKTMLNYKNTVTEGRIANQKAFGVSFEVVNYKRNLIWRGVTA